MSKNPKRDVKKELSVEQEMLEKFLKGTDPAPPKKKKTK